MNHDLTLKEIQKEYHGTISAYIIGFFCSLVLTALSFLLVQTRIFSDQGLILTIVVLALIQTLVQLLLFLHLGREDKPRWETIVFCFMVIVLLVIAIGSFWVMNDLNDRVMSGMN